MRKAEAILEEIVETAEHNQDVYMFGAAVLEILRGNDVINEAVYETLKGL